ncbi:MAG: PQQ-like beta-propeller repeat protein [Gemmatimonadota bacterium]|nr:PQQ-like beta-propeller repeat protein [Gemmatimonadota bacterium]MDH5197661.1 PQQ-like beta-propeller repeat protein [Gemmatimonadota bacterium]
MGVNATACAPRRIELPDADPAAWREPLGTSTRAPSADEVVPEHPAPWWRASLGRAVSGPPAMGKDVIVAVGLDRYLTVLERQTGDRLWRKRLNAPGAASPLVDGNRVYAATGGREGRLFGFTLDGKRRWDRGVGPITGPIALADSLLIAATEVGQVVACDAGTGEVRWTRRLTQAIRAGVLPVTGAVLIATDDSVFRLALATGEIEARAGLPGTAVAPAARQGDTVVATTADGQIVTFRAGDLSLIWSLDVGAPVFGGPAIARDSVFAVSIRGVLWRVPLGNPDAADGIPIGAAVRAPASPVRHGVLIGTLGGEIVLVAGGAVMPQGRVEGPIEQAVVVSNGAMFVVDGRGRLHAWR